MSDKRLACLSCPSSYLRRSWPAMPGVLMACACDPLKMGACPQSKNSTSSGQQDLTRAASIPKLQRRRSKIKLCDAAAARPSTSDVFLENDFADASILKANQLVAWLSLDPEFENRACHKEMQYMTSTRKEYCEKHSCGNGYDACNDFSHEVILGSFSRTVPMSRNTFKKQCNKHKQIYRNCVF